MSMENASLGRLRGGELIHFSLPHPLASLGRLRGGEPLRRDL